MHSLETFKLEREIICTYSFVLAATTCPINTLTAPFGLDVSTGCPVDRVAGQVLVAATESGTMVVNNPWQSSPHLLRRYSNYQIISIILNLVMSHVLSVVFDDGGGREMGITFSRVARSSGLGNAAFSSATTDSRSEIVRGRV